MRIKITAFMDAESETDAITYLSEHSPLEDITTEVVD